MTYLSVPRSTPPTFSTHFSLNSQEGEIVRLLRRNRDISRTEIAELTGWSRAKVSNLVGHLIRKEILMEIGEGDSRGGRKPRHLSLGDKLGYVAGIDLGATSLDLALADICGNIVQRCSESADVRDDPEIVLGRCVEALMGLIKNENLTPDRVLGIGIGVPGPVEFSRGVLVAPPLMPAWENYPIRDFFQKTFINAVVVVDNDVNIMALGEQYSGSGAGLQNFIYVKVGTGIGSGIISNGRIHRGSIGCAGDIGHICVDKTGPICRCGNVGCLEAMAAGPAIAARAVEAAQNGRSPILARRMEANGGILRAEDVGAAFREGDREALEIIQSSGQMIGDVLAALVNFFNPSHIFVSGGVTNLGNQFLASIHRAVLTRSLPLATRHLVINFSPSGPEAGITGAISMILEHIFSPSDSLIRD